MTLIILQIRKKCFQIPVFRALREQSPAHILLPLVFLQKEMVAAVPFNRELPRAGPAHPFLRA